MLTRSAFGLVIALATVSGALADARTHATNNTSGTASEPTVWGWKYTPPQEQPGLAVVGARGQAVNGPSGAYNTESRPGSASEPTVWGWKYTPPQEPVRR